MNLSRLSRKEEEGEGSQVGGVGQASDQFESLAALHYLSWTVHLQRQESPLGPNVVLWVCTYICGGHTYRKDMQV